MKNKQKALQKVSIFILAMILCISVFPGNIFAATYRYTMSVGDTKYLYTNSSEAVTSASWTTSDYRSVEIIDQNSVSCQIKVKSYTSSTPVIIHCEYYYMEYFNGYPYMRSGYTDYYITVNKPSGSNENGSSGLLSASRSYIELDLADKDKNYQRITLSIDKDAGWGWYIRDNSGNQDKAEVSYGQKNGYTTDRGFEGLKTGTSYVTFYLYSNEGEKLDSTKITLYVYCSHKYDAGTITKAPTESEKGTRVYTCSVCKKTKTENITLEQLAAEKLPYTDVLENDASHKWFYDAVAYCYKNKLMIGKTDTAFAPQDKVSRAQIATILHRIEKEPDVEYTAVFPDVADGMWYSDSVLWANKEGIVKGYGNTGLFAPDADITREEMTVMMYRYAKFKEYNVNKSADFSKFDDGSKVSQFAADAMKWAVGSGIINGKSDNLLDPQGATSRAECAIIIQRFTELYGA